MSVSLAKVSVVVVDHEGVQYRGVPCMINSERVTFKITAAVGHATGIRYPWVTGRKITVPKINCSLFR